MELRYLGFKQLQNTRSYRFDRVAKGEPTIRFVVNADLALFLKHHIAIQEGPVLCARKLTDDLGKLQKGDHELTNEDLLVLARARAAEETRKAESRRKSFRRRPRPEVARST